VNLRESVGIALGAIRANKLRSFLTLLGTIIGVGSVIAVLSFVEGLNQYVTQKLLNAGSNVFVVDKWGLITSQDAYEEASKRPNLRPDDADALRGGVDGAVAVVCQAEAGAQTVRWKNHVMKGVNVIARGAGYERVEDFEIEQGTSFSELDDRRSALVCVLGPEVAEEEFEGQDPVGREIRVGANAYRVLGVTKAKGKLFGQSQDRFVAIPFRTWVKYQADPERLQMEIAVKSVDQAAMPGAEQQARNIMRGRRHLGPGKPDNFAITTSDTWLELYHTLTGGIFVVTIGVAAISLIVGGIVIMNIMLVSVTERTREIGIRKALGARRRDVLGQFLVESTTLSLSGGLIGVFGGVGVALLAGLLSPLPAAVNVPGILLGIAMSCLVGIFFGSYPAFRAARLDPIEALRYE
jgi:putative ABC transport system permease protein